MMKYETALASNKGLLDAIKQKLPNQDLTNFLRETKRCWSPKTKVFSGNGIHGSKDGESYSYTMYWDDHHQVWTSEEMAFKSHVLQHVGNAIALLIPTLFYSP